FVVGEDRSGRMTATLELLAEHTKALPPPADWLYLQNFRHPDRPQPYRLPAGSGPLFRDRIAALIPAFPQSLARAFGAGEFAARLDHESQAMQQAVGATFAELETFAAQRGLKIERTPQGLALNPLPGNEPEALGQLPEAERQRRLEGFAAVRQNLGLF